MSAASQARKQQAWLDAKATTREATARLEKALEAVVEARLDEERKRLDMLGAPPPGSNEA